MRLKPVKCAICGVDDSQKLYPANFSVKDLTRQTFSARRIPDRVHYRIVCCKRCGLVYSNPILDPKTITSLYKESSITYEEQQDDLSRTYGKYLARVRPLMSSRSDPKLLEIGCGNGFFLEYLRNNGWTDVWGVEPSSSATLSAPTALKRRLVNSILRPNLFPKDSFDYICAFQTLDHVTDPNKFLRICWQLLKPGGKMLLINHDVSSWSAKILGEKSPIIDIEHIYLFDPYTMKLILRKNRFTAVDVFRVTDRHRLGYWVRMVPFPQASKRLALWILARTGLSRLPVNFPAGNLGVVAEK